MNKNLYNKVVKYGILPNEQQVLLLKACLTDGDEAKNYFKQWFASYPFPKDLKTASSKIGLPAMYDVLDSGSQRMLSLLYKNQLNVGNDHPIIKMLQGYYKYVWYRNQMLKSRYQQVYNVFAEKGIPCIVFKGIALSEYYYQDHGARIAVDIDLYVGEEKWNAAVSVLSETGWSSKCSNPNDLPKTLVHAHTFKNGELELDLHYHINYYHISDQTKQQIWDNGKDINGFRLLPNHIELMLTFLHGLQFNLVPTIRWVADSVMILKTFQKDDWEAFISTVKNEENAAIISVALKFLSTHKFYQIPIQVTDRIEQLKTSKKNLNIFSSFGLRSKPNDFKMAFFTLFSISKRNNYNPLKTIVGILDHYKYMWDVADNTQLFTMSLKRLIDKILKPKRPFQQNSK